jgi:hypothetical protein
MLYLCMTRQNIGALSFSGRFAGTKSRRANFVYSYWQKQRQRYWCQSLPHYELSGTDQEDSLASKQQPTNYNYDWHSYTSVHPGACPQTPQWHDFKTQNILQRRLNEDSTFGNFMALLLRDFMCWAGNAVALQVGRSRVRLPIGSMGFFIDYVSGVDPRFSQKWVPWAPRVQAVSVYGWQPCHKHVPQPPGALRACPRLYRDCFTSTMCEAFVLCDIAIRHCAFRDHVMPSSSNVDR